MAIKKGTLDELLSGRDPKEVFSKDGLFDELKKALAERVLNAELGDHLDGQAAAGKANHRNGYSKKTLLAENAKHAMPTALSPAKARQGRSVIAWMGRTFALRLWKSAGSAWRSCYSVGK